MNLTSAELLDLLPASLANAMLNDAAIRAEAQHRLDSESTDNYIPYPPHSGPQDAFINDDSKEILYGGAAGGGKTDALLMSALKYVDVPGYSAVIFRRTFPMLNIANEGLIARSKEWLMNTDARWHEGNHRWTFPSGATLTFSHLQHDDSVYDHQGAAYQFIGWDELTQFTKFQYTYLFSRCRRPKELSTRSLRPSHSRPELTLATVPLRVRSASNPGGVGHVWVKKRFIDEVTTLRKYIPAKLIDNPALDYDSYVESLGELDPITLKQLLEGNWDASEDGLLPWNVIAAVRAACLWPNGVKPENIRRPELYVGVDVGRTTHNTVIWTWEKLGDVKWCRELHVLRHKDRPMSFGEQKKEIRRRLSSNVVACKIDKGGIGMQLAEELEAEFPGVVEGVQLTPGRQGQLAKRMQVEFGQRRVRIPFDDDLEEDLQLVRKTEMRNGIPIVQTDEGPSGHADRFWAGALGLFGVPTVERPKPKSAPRGKRTRYTGRKEA